MPRWCSARLRSAPRAGAAPPRPRCWPTGWGCPEQVLGPGDELLAVVGGGEDAALGRGPRSGRAAPSAVARASAIQRASPVASREPGEGVDEGRVVGGVGQVPGAAVGLPRPQPAALLVAQVAEQELGDGDRGLDPLGPAPAAPASARLPTNRAFHSVSTLSSRPGRIRLGTGVEEPLAGGLDVVGTAQQVAHRWCMRSRMVRPSKLPASSRSYQAMAAAARSGSSAHLVHLVRASRRRSGPPRPRSRRPRRE